MSNECMNLARQGIDCSSVPRVHIAGVTGSSPVPPTKPAKENQSLSSASGCDDAVLTVSKRTSFDGRPVPRRKPRIVRFGGHYYVEWWRDGEAQRTPTIAKTAAEAGRLLKTWVPPTIIRRRPSEFVYFVQSGDGGPIKIGIAADVRARLRYLDCASPYPLRLLGVVNGSHETEQELHKRFAQSHMRREWFRPTPELLAYIKTNCVRDDTAFSPSPFLEGVG